MSWGWCFVRSSDPGGQSRFGFASCHWVQLWIEWIAWASKLALSSVRTPQLWGIVNRRNFAFISLLDSEPPDLDCQGRSINFEVTKSNRFRALIAPVITVFLHYVKAERHLSKKQSDIFQVLVVHNKLVWFVKKILQTVKHGLGLAGFTKSSTAATVFLSNSIRCVEERIFSERVAYCDAVTVMHHRYLMKVIENCQHEIRFAPQGRAATRIR